MIVSLGDLPGKLLTWAWEDDNCRIVLAHGCFDLLHIGHIRHLEEAKRLGTILVVTITADRYVDKGKGRPLFDENIRAECVNALRCVDFVAINEYGFAPIAAVLPAVYVKGAEYRDSMTPGLKIEKELIEKIGGQLVFTSGDECHTTQILQRLEHGLDEASTPAWMTPGLKDYSNYLRAKERMK